MATAFAILALFFSLVLVRSTDLTWMANFGVVCGLAALAVLVLELFVTG